MKIQKSFVFLTLKVVLFSGLQLKSEAQNLQFKGRWNLGEPGNTPQYWDPSCTRPQVVVEEDFTDSAFNGFNSGVNGANWQFFASGVAFRRPNNRSTFPLAVARNPYVSAGGWAGVLWGNRINPALGHADPNLVEYKIDKKDDIFVTRFRAFSDFAHRNERAGVEVANMETRMVLCPDPDYCHDLSFEAKQNFYTRPQDDLQLETNVENTTDRSPLGARRAHYNNLTTKADLDKEYDNLVIWRNDPFSKRSNVEQWGAANYGDFWLDTHMVSKLDPGNRYALISEVQVSLFAGDTNVTLLRDNVDRRNMQIGILNVHSGITKRSDFNLDYRIDTLDLAILKRYLGRTDSATVRRGDADNDGKILARDCNALTAFWSDSTVHPDSASAGASFTYLGGQGPPPPPSDGILTLRLNNVSYLSIKTAGSSGLQSPTLQALQSASDVFQTNLAIGEFVFFKRDGFRQTVNLGYTGSLADAENISFTVNYPGSCQSDGFRFTLDSIFVFTGLENAKETIDNLLIGGTRFRVPVSVKDFQMEAYDLQGKFQGRFEFDRNTANSLERKLPEGVLLLILREKQTGRYLGHQKQIRFPSLLK